MRPAVVALGLAALLASGATAAAADNRPAPIAVPDVVGLGFDAAAIRIGESGLCIQLAARLDRSRANTILAQSPRPGTRVGRNALVRIVVALWPRFSRPDAVSVSESLSFTPPGCPPARAAVTRNR